MGRAQQRLLLLALSIGAHLVVLGWLLVQRHVLSPLPETPSMEVLLAPPIFRRPRRRARMPPALPSARRSSARSQASPRRPRRLARARPPRRRPCVGLCAA